MAYDPQGAGAAPTTGGGRTSGKAIGSLVLGILSILFGGLPGLIVGIIALFLTSGARKDIAAEPGLGGAGLATAGFVLAIIGIVLSVLLLITVGIFWL